MTTSPPAIFLQDACYKHKYIRSRDISNIVERPERLRAVKLGLAVALARLEEIVEVDDKKLVTHSGTDDLASVMERLKLDGAASGTSTATASTFAGIPVIHSSASMQLLGSPAVKYIHGDIEGDVYLEKLHHWAKESEEKVGRGESEIPGDLSQGDLYLCPESMDAIEGALGTVCEAVDTVISGNLPASASSSSQTNVKRAFVAVRPPGHHCGEDTPCGFCFVNNVAVGAAHANLKHGIIRVVIFDIDLHHGNGTQSIVWGINEETYRQTLEAESGPDALPTKPGMKVYYGSIHDILSFPCEDGKPDLVQAASVSINGPHGQWIENIHLEAYEDEPSFHELYESNYSRLIRKAEQFLDATGGPGEDVLVFISCGMDACEHEYTSMSRHGRKVPVSFYHRFTRDACQLADQYAKGRLVSVLEGGYSDRALISGTLAHLCGMVGVSEGTERVISHWWHAENLEKAEKIIKKRNARSARPSGIGASHDGWVDRTSDIFSSIDSAGAAVLAASSRRTKAATATATAPTRVLRDRKAKTAFAGSTPTTSLPKQSISTTSVAGTDDTLPVLSSAESESDGVDSEATSTTIATSAGMGAYKKLPRVILKLGPNPAES